jgi:hypothetical protein
VTTASVPVTYIRSGAAIPSRFKPRASTRAVRSHSASRLIPGVALGAQHRALLVEGGERGGHAVEVQGEPVELIDSATAAMTPSKAKASARSAGSDTTGGMGRTGSVDRTYPQPHGFCSVAPQLAATISAAGPPICHHNVPDPDHSGPLAGVRPLSLTGPSAVTASSG